ncbi:DUF6463 family protein [Nocardia wallacei]|uniref:DUF6463 family protein n=1 Tax=Nocardia wallacei TaxID=480035 RepID=UPI0024570250|nr:DUF6463 family protein [Nocardia wallacei]
MIRWGGYLLTFLGAGHTVAGLILTAPREGDAWFNGQLWQLDEGVTPMSQPMATFWLTTGSFGIPLVMIGLLVVWLDRRDIVPPLFLAWMLGIWSLVCGVIMEPAPWPLAWIAVGLLVAGAHRAAAADQPRGVVAGDRRELRLDA